MYSQKWNCAASLFLRQKYNVLSPNFHIHVSVSDLYIPRISLPILLPPNMNVGIGGIGNEAAQFNFWGYINWILCTVHNNSAIYQHTECMYICSFDCWKYPTQIYWNFTAAIPKPNRGIYSALKTALASPNWRHRSNPDSENCSAESAAYNYQKIRRRVSCVLFVQVLSAGEVFSHLGRPDRWIRRQTSSS
jgi:hypothetical protein